MKTQIIIMAGGKGTRMKSDQPKVLTLVKGQSIISRQLEEVVKVCERPVIVVGHQGEKVVEATNNQHEYVWQKEQLGTGHALMCAKEQMEKTSAENIIVIPGDHPLVKAKTLLDLSEKHQKSGAVLTLLTVQVEDYTGENEVFYNCGRIIRDTEGQVRGIVELKDTDVKQKEIKEVNVSFYCFNAEWLWKNIGKLKNENQAKEYYLTDMIGLAISQGLGVNAVPMADKTEGMGVNTREQLELIEKQII